MPLYSVAKNIEFCYGHRLVDHFGKCRYLHGHNGLLEIEVKSANLNESGMVIDFNELGDLVKSWIDDNLDHRMILWQEDPAVDMLKTLGEPVYLLDCNPTAENIARHIFEKVEQAGLELSKVCLWETSTSYATYKVS